MKPSSPPNNDERQVPRSRFGFPNVHFEGPSIPEKNTRHPRQKRNAFSRKLNLRCDKCGEVCNVGESCRCGTRCRTSKDLLGSAKKARERAERIAADVQAEEEKLQEESRAKAERRKRQAEKKKADYEKKQQEEEFERQRNKEWQNSEPRRRFERDREEERRKSEQREHQERRRQEKAEEREFHERQRQEGREQRGERPRRSNGARPSPPVTTRPADLYALLGVSRWATQDEVLKAAKKKRIETHPDKFSGKGLSPSEVGTLVEQSMLTGQAADILCDPLSRLKHDNELDAWDRKQDLAGSRPDQAPAREPESGQDSTSSHASDFGQERTSSRKSKPSTPDGPHPEDSNAFGGGCSADVGDIFAHFQRQAQGTSRFDARDRYEWLREEYGSVLQEWM